MRHPDLPSGLALDERSGLPDDLKFLLADYPRETWSGHDNLGQVCRFWLDRHQMFRELIAALRDANDGLREGQIAADAFRPWFVPRFNFFLQQLHAHHQIEDLHYFPVFVRAERRLTRGFDLLENDHDVIHHRLETLLQAGIALDRGIETGGDALKRNTEHAADRLHDFVGALGRHLEDEEDLIVPVILDRGERTLGLS